MVNGDGAEWIGECESYFHQCIYTLDRFHVARDLKRFVGHLPKVWEASRTVVGETRCGRLADGRGACAEQEIAPEKQEEWTAYKSFLRRHAKHLEDYRKSTSGERDRHERDAADGKCGSPDADIRQTDEARRVQLE